MAHDDQWMSVYPMYGYSEDAINALERALRESFGNVKVTRDIQPSGGAAEMFFLLAVTGSAIYAKGFLETLGSEHAKAANNVIASAPKRRQDHQGRTRSVPLRIDVEGIRLYFRHLDNGDVLRERAHAALPLLEASLGTPRERTPAGTISDSVAIPAIEGCGYYWDLQTESWQRAPVDWVGEVCPQTLASSESKPLSPRRL